MVLNLEYQICGLILVLLTLGMFFKRRNLKRLTDKVYGVLLFAVTACIILDILSVICITYHHDLPDLFIAFLCKGHAFSIVFVNFLILIYVLAAINHRYLKMKHYIISYIIPCLGTLIAFFLFPIYYHATPSQLYAFGPYIICVYFISIFYLILSILYTIRYQKSIDSEKKNAIVFFISAIIISGFLQFFHNEWLITSFTFSVAMVFMYMCLENPDENIDKETGVFNNDALQAFISELHIEQKDFCSITLVFDDFKFIKETFGPSNSSQLMKSICNFLLQLEGGVVFRNSEYAFSIVFEISDENFSINSKLIQERFEQPWKIDDLELLLAPYICKLPTSHIASSSLPKDLIELIYSFIMDAKKKGDETIILIDEKALLRKQKEALIEQALHNAIENDGIHVYYQPIYSTIEKRYSSAEALVRIFDSEGNLIPPDIFIPIAEQNGLILKLGMQVFEKVCRFAKEHDLKGKGIHYIEVNISVIQCMQENLAQELLSVMQKYNISPSFINLEITETAAVNSETTLIQNMNHYIENGGTFSLDDYGTGYSNLNYIIDLPFYIIKLDKELVWAYFINEKSKVVMDFSISMIKQLGMKIVAEGIETSEQHEKMQELGIDYIQGFYFSRPVKEEEFLKLISSNLS